MDLRAYKSRLKQAQEDTGLQDAVVNAQGKLNGRLVILSAQCDKVTVGGVPIHRERPIELIEDPIMRYAGLVIALGLYLTYAGFESTLAGFMARMRSIARRE